MHHLFDQMPPLPFRTQPHLYYRMSNPVCPRLYQPSATHPSNHWGYPAGIPEYYAPAIGIVDTPTICNRLKLVLIDSCPIRRVDQNRKIGWTGGATACPFA